MTMAEYQIERHHRCNEWQCLLSDEVLPYDSKDWTLFPSEEMPLAEPAPRPVTVNGNAITPRPPQGRAQNNTKPRKQQRRNCPRKDRTMKPHTSCATRKPSSWSATERNGTSLTGSSTKVECSDVLTCQVTGFEDVPRTSKSAPTFGRRPTPPLEDMGEMFAPIEALGEDLRWYRSVQGSHNGYDQPL